MAKEALHKIVKAEETADHAIAEAKTKAHDLVTQAETDAKNLHTKSLKEAKERAIQAEEKMKADLKPQLDAITSQAEKDGQELRKETEVHMDKAVSFLTERMLKNGNS